MTTEALLGVQSGPIQSETQQPEKAGLPSGGTRHTATGQSSQQRGPTVIYVLPQAEDDNLDGAVARVLRAREQAYRW